MIGVCWLFDFNPLGIFPPIVNTIIIIVLILLVMGYIMGIGFNFAVS
jgi:hypothetical protein